MGCGPSKVEIEKQQKEEEERAAKAKAGAGGRKRGSVAAQGGMDPTKMEKVNLATIPKVEKSPEAMARIHACVDNTLLFKALSKEYLDAIVASMTEVQVKKGINIITQGEKGDFWYVVDTGAFEAFKKMDGDEAPGKKVKSYSVGESFGELALMYNQRRAASVIATEDSTLWAVQQEVFKTLILSAAMQNKESY